MSPQLTDFPPDVQSRIQAKLDKEDARRRKSVLIEEAPTKPNRYEIKKERELQSLCEQELNRRGIVYHHLSPKARETIGLPDLLFAIKGHPYAVELKTETGRLTQEQEIMLQQMATERNGWRTHVIRSFDQFRALFNADLERSAGSDDTLRDFVGGQT